MKISRHEQKLNEFCEVGQLEQYRMVLDSLFKKLAESKVKFSARYDEDFSCITNYLEDGFHIKISLRNVKKPLDIIWKLLHEYGHFLSGERQPDDTDIYREEIAWQQADSLLLLYPELLMHKQAYTICKEYCLGTYRSTNNIAE